MEKKVMTISRQFRRRLAIIVVAALVISTAVIFLFNTSINDKNYAEILLSTLNDIEKDVMTTSDVNMLELAALIKGKVEVVLRDVPREDVSAVGSALQKLASENGLAEISIVGKDNVLIYSNIAEYIGFDMNTTEESREFDKLNHGTTELVQPFRLNAYHGEGDYDQYNKYAGVTLEGIGYLQVAYNSRQYQELIDGKIGYIATNRHIGQTGYVIISNLDGVVVSNADDREVSGESRLLSELGLHLERDGELQTAFSAEVSGKPSLCMASFVEGYYLIGVVPDSEVQSFRNRAVLSNTLIELLVFALMFFCISRMIRSLIVSKIRNINRSLHRIIAGELDTTVNEYSTKEFTELSYDINSTVKSLKNYMEREKEKTQQELKLAKAIQLGTLPKVSSLASVSSAVRISARMDTAKEVGGDFYDFFVLNGTNLVFLVADVSGKGVPAAMFMMTCKTMLKDLTDSGLPLDEVFRKANDQLMESNESGMFVTIWTGVLDLETGHLRYVNAGHTQPVFRNAEGGTEFLHCTPNLLLMGIPEARYEIRHKDLRHGDTLFLYTDGVTEAMDRQENMYGKERLLSFFADQKDASPEELLTAIRADIDRFTEGAEPFDDITMLAIQYL